MNVYPNAAGNRWSSTKAKTSSRWIVALSLLQDEPNDPIAIVYDQAQNLYDTSAPVPQLAKPSPLRRTQLPQQQVYF